jgi:ATP-binding cassette subfamily B protein
MADDKKRSFREQFEALRNLPRFFRLIWKASPGMTLVNALLRLLKSAVPLLVLYVGKEIIDSILLLIDGEGTDTTYLWTMVGLEFALAIVSDLMNRGITLLDSLLGDLFANRTSVELIEHAARLDL